MLPMVVQLAQQQTHGRAGVKKFHLQLMISIYSMLLRTSNRRQFLLSPTDERLLHGVWPHQDSAHSHLKRQISPYNRSFKAQRGAQT